jgi:hypothetical protein
MASKTHQMRSRNIGRTFEREAAAIKANALADVLKEHPGKIIDLGK